MKINTSIYKTFLLIQLALLFTSTYSNAQIKICEKQSFWYSQCYQIRVDSFFIYTYGHCTGSVIGKGHYTTFNQFP
ncbi:MAG: hypothetical protein ACPGVB_04450 [Chitinophagales bacterium]